LFLFHSEMMRLMFSRAKPVRAPRDRPDNLRHAEKLLAERRHR
jgi:hypothetical protein